MKHLLLSISLITILLSCYKPDHADLIVHNAKIYTCDKNFTIVEAMAIKDGKILQVGPEREILNGYSSDEIIDAELQPIYPGFYDAHCHFTAYANTLNEVNLVGCKSFNEVIDRVIQFDKKVNPKWIKGRGWDQNLWDIKEFPNNDSLSKLFPEKPIFIRRIDGHTALANKKTLELANITINTICEGGQILSNQDELTGILIDNALNIVNQVIPEIDKSEQLALLQKAEQDLFAQGLTSINDAGVDPIERQNFINWYLKGDLKINSYMMLFPEEDNLKFALENNEFDSMGLHINSFKLIADGALGSRGACLIHHYTDSVDHFGTILKSKDKIRSIAKTVSNLDFQMNTHCIGDSANRLMLNIYKDVIGAKPDHRWKIEHAQVLNPADFDLFEYLNIIPSVQPTHCTSDMPWAPKKLGEERIPFAYAYQTLLKKSGIIVLGTDFPIESISTLATFYAAVTRKNNHIENHEGYNIIEALSRKESLLGMTYWAAYSNFEEHERGSLEAGKNADFIFLNKDIMTVNEDQLLSTFVMKTFLNGNLVYSEI